MEQFSKFSGRVMTELISSKKLDCIDKMLLAISWDSMYLNPNEINQCFHKPSFVIFVASFNVKPLLAFSKAPVINLKFFKALYF